MRGKFPEPKRGKSQHGAVQNSEQPKDGIVIAGQPREAGGNERAQRGGEGVDALANGKDKAVPEGQVLARTVSDVPILPGMTCVEGEEQGNGKGQAEYHQGKTRQTSRLRDRLSSSHVFFRQGHFRA